MNNNHNSVSPTILVIFGITGDLAKRYLLPSLYHLVKDGLLHQYTHIIGVTRSDINLDQLLSKIELCVSEVDGICDPLAMAKLKSKLSIKNMDLNDSSSFVDLKNEMQQIESKYNTHMNRLFYLSVPPSVSESLINMLGKSGLNTGCEHRKSESRLLMEKPFGHDYASAKHIINVASKWFKESQIYRIDHYLAKETVQNLLTFRFNNPIFEPLWNHKYVDFIEVLAEEKLDIEGRVNFYENVGALRDLIQSHLLQILALITMEQPTDLSSNNIHKYKLNLLKKISKPKMSQVDNIAVRGQYSNYKDEVNNQNSCIETYAALKLNIKNRRWNNVPIIVKTGKALKDKRSQINIIFKPTKGSPHHNELTFNLQPNEGISLSLRVKKPGYEDRIQPANMDFSYKNSFKDGLAPTAYERVIVDAVKGDQTLFSTSSEILESWSIVQPIIKKWASNSHTVQTYKKGSEGPVIEHLYPEI